MFSPQTTSTDGNKCGGNMFVLLMCGVLFTVALVSVILILRNNHGVLENHLDTANPSDATQAANWFNDNVGQAVKNGVETAGINTAWVPIVTAGTAGTAGTWFASKLQKGPFTAMIYTAFALLSLAASFYGLVKVGMFVGNCHEGVGDFIGDNAHILQILPWCLVSAAVGMPVLYGACTLIGGIGGSGDSQGDVVYVPMKSAASLPGPNVNVAYAPAAAGATVPAAPSRRLICSANVPSIELIGLLSIFATLIFMVWKCSALLDAKSVPPTNYVAKKPASFPLSPRQVAGMVLSA